MDGERDEYQDLQDYVEELNAVLDDKNKQLQDLLSESVTTCLCQVLLCSSLSSNPPPP